MRIPLYTLIPLILYDLMPDGFPTVSNITCMAWCINNYRYSEQQVQKVIDALIADKIIIVNLAERGECCSLSNDQIDEIRRRYELEER